VQCVSGMSWRITPDRRRRIHV